MTEKAMNGKRKRFKTKRERSVCQPIAFNESDLKKMILSDALALKIPTGTAEVVAAKVVEQVSKWIEKRPTVTADDVHRRIALEAEKYSADLAYVYQNRGKII